MYKITDTIDRYPFLILELRLESGELRYWCFWDDLDEILMKKYGVTDLIGLEFNELPPKGDWIPREEIYKI